MPITESEFNAQRATVIISAQHRQLILTALINARDSGYLGADADDREEMDLLVGMFDDLNMNDPETFNDFTA